MTRFKTSNRIIHGILERLEPNVNAGFCNLWADSSKADNLQSTNSGEESAAEYLRLMQKNNLIRQVNEDRVMYALVRLTEYGNKIKQSPGGWLGHTYST